MKHLGSIAYIGLLVIAAAVLSGCAGLSVNFDVAASYRSDIPLGQRGAK